MPKKQPLRLFEDIAVFYGEQPIYNPIMIKRDRVVTGHDLGTQQTYGKTSGKYTAVYTHKYPVNHLIYAKEWRCQAPTQKPVALFEYLIRTYTNEGEVVLDNCMGSGTTGVACVNTGRDFIGMDIEAKYVVIARQRVRKAMAEIR